MKNHKKYDLCYRAHLGTSFTPEVRAESYCKMYDTDLAKVIELGGSVIKFERLFDNWLNAKSNCISSMITGGSNFPVARANKANERERNHGEAYFKFFESLENKKSREERGEVIIKASDDDAVEKLQAKIDALELVQSQMKAFNKISLSKKLSNQEKLDQVKALNITSEVLRYTENGGFPSYKLTNNNAKIKNAKARLESIKLNKSLDVADKIYDGFRIVHNTDIQRIQFVFDDKPNADIISLLKSKSFRWSPREKAWQRQMTANTKSAVEKIIIEINNLVK
jgi:uncharacterized protein (DUF934 family)